MPKITPWPKISSSEKPKQIVTDISDETPTDSYNKYLFTYVHKIVDVLCIEYF